VSPDCPFPPSPPAWHERVAVMLEDIESIRSFIGNHDRQSFGGDQKAVFAVCYAFVRLGEAIVHIPEDVRAAHPQVDWVNTRKYRNFVIHVYLVVDPPRVYDTAKGDLDALEAGLRELLK
jgi:uncharacterized protein with HEPN domain